jgi:DNA repair exonuclease SbcCD ATPase subunit
METEKVVDKADDVTTPEVKATPTPEQQLSTLQAEVKAKDDEIKKVNASIQGLRGSLQEKDKLIKEQTSLREEISTLRESQKILAAMLAEKDGITDEANPERKSEYLKKYNEIEEKQKKKAEEAKRKEAYEKQVEVVTSYQKKVEELGLKEGDDDYDEIKELVTKGFYKMADNKIKKLDKEKTVTNAKPNEELETLKKQIAEKDAELKKFKGGGLESETGKPSGVANAIYSRTEIANMSISDYEAKKVDIEKALKEGRIKD